MRKILLIIVIVLLIILGFTSVINGVQIGDFKIYSIQEIGQQSEELDNQIHELNTSIDDYYPDKRQELTETSKKMQSIKEEYLNEINASTNEELGTALQIKNYEIESLWARVGNHAIDQGVNMTLEVKPGSSSDTRNLEFTVKGTYLGQINFLYAIEDDEELNFRIYNYKLTPNNGNVLKATFLIKDVRITKSMNESLNSEIGANDAKETSVNTNNKNNTNTTNNTNTNTSSTSQTTYTAPQATPTPEKR